MVRSKLVSFALASAIAVILAMPPASRADVIIYRGAGSIQPDENLLFNLPGLNPGPATTVTGATQSGFIIDLTSNENLVTPSGGQARVQASDHAFSTLTLSPNSANPNFGFTELEFNVNVLRGQSGLLRLDFIGIGFADFSTTVDLNSDPLSLSGNGQNFFGIEAINDQFITSVTLTALQGGNPAQIIQDVRQIRLSGVADTGDPGGPGTTETPVPEPTSLVLWGLCGLGLVAARRAYRSKAAPVAA